MKLIVFSFLLVVVVVLSIPLEDKKNGLKADSKEVQALGQSLKAPLEKEDFKKFVEFIKKFDRRYTNVNELKRRFTAFQATQRRIEELQKKSPTAKYGVTKFSDFEPSELNSITGYGTSPQTKTTATHGSKKP